MGFKKKMNFLMQRTGLSYSQLKEIAERSKYYHFDARLECSISQSELRRYKFFVINNTGVLIFPVTTLSGTQWRVIYDNSSYFPHYSSFLLQSGSFEKGYVCRTTDLIAISTKDVSFLKKHSFKFHEFMEQSIHSFLDCIINQQIVCTNVTISERIKNIIFYLAKQYGHPISAKEIALHVRHCDLESLAIATNQAIVNSINDLKKKKIARIKWKSIILKREYLDKRQSEI